MSKLKNELIKRLIDIEDDDEILKFLDVYVRLHKDKLENNINISNGFGGGSGGMGIYYNNPLSAASIPLHASGNPLDNSVYFNSFNSSVF